MITITHRNNTITVRGHAGYAEIGKDIVCASISTLTQVFVASVEEMTDDKLKCEISAGNAFIEYENLSEKSRTLLDSFFIGCRMIADSYPQYVRID
jgi:uncharacterized protein YsxB (DUF464 family)